jgi:putative ABC transport system ATP-binding protein
MSSAAQTLIRLESLTKVFYTDEVETHALAGVHLEIKTGEFVSIAGPSGCGKSTLLSILGLLDSPTDGSYWIHTEPVEKLSLSDRTRIRNREIGFIFQAFNLIGDLTVFENVELPLTYRSMGARWRIAPNTIRRSFPEVSNSAWPWRGRSSGSLRFCWPMSRPETSIRKTAKR